MLQLVRRHHGLANPQTASKVFSEFIKAWSVFRRKDQRKNSALLVLAAVNLFAVSGAVSLYLLMRN